MIHGSRSSNDIRRDWKRVSDTARQNLSRNWQNGRLWWNDPDAIVLTGELSEDEFRFHATAIYASGGMILSGDDLTTITPPRLAMLRKLQPPTAKAARFADVRMEVGEVDLDPRQPRLLPAELGRPAARAEHRVIARVPSARIVERRRPRHEERPHVDRDAAAQRQGPDLQRLGVVTHPAPDTDGLLGH